MSNLKDLPDLRGHFPRYRWRCFRCDESWTRRTRASRRQSGDSGLWDRPVKKLPLVIICLESRDPWETCKNRWVNFVKNFRQVLKENLKVYYQLSQKGFRQPSRDALSVDLTLRRFVKAFSDDSSGKVVQVQLGRERRWIGVRHHCLAGFFQWNEEPEARAEQFIADDLEPFASQSTLKNRHHIIYRKSKH